MKITTPSFKEDHISQIPALQLLVNMGYKYLSQEEALQLRGNSTRKVLLQDILEQQLKKLNRFSFKGSEHEFSDSNIQRAIDALREVPLNEGLMVASENVFDLLVMGKSFEQNVDGDRKSFTLQYIDWENPENNEYHVTEELEVERTGLHEHYRPDIVLYVNGIPLVVIECKRPDIDKPIEQAVSQHIRNQKEDGIRQLFKYSQLLIATSGNDSKYATTGTSEDFWAVWKEQFQNDEQKSEYETVISKLKNTPIQEEVKDRLFTERFRYVRQYFDLLEEIERKVTKQDRDLYSLCRPERLLELIYKFIVYDAGTKKIARYQQYFAVKKTLRKVKNLEQGRRKGGVIWHTQGSGKSLTMVMLAKSLALDYSNSKIVVVTDRVDLDKQIHDTFNDCGKEVVKASSGKELMKLVEKPKYDIITTVIDKFESGLERQVTVNESSEIFVLVDESHRSQYGTANVKMQKVLPNACYIGFTGTPLLKKDKNTAQKFGGIIDKYTIDQAVKDKAVVPLLYEGRLAVQDVNRKPIDTYFDRISQPLTEKQAGVLKDKFSRADQLNEAEQKLYAIAWDVSEHFRDNWQGTEYKAQLTAPSKAAAVKYKQFFDRIGIIKSDVLISGPDTREGHEDIFSESEDVVLRFWHSMMDKYGNEERYNRQLIDAFKKSDEPELIIVVDKLLTGFDAPRNTVLYITRSLKEHTLLQAIARVNRVHTGKDYGYIIDYYGILGELDKALTTYSSLSSFDEEDLIGTLTNVKEEIANLKQYHSEVWDIFNVIQNRQDLEEYEQLLADDELRNDFYDSLSKFARTLKLALSTLEFEEQVPEDEVNMYKNDSRFFLKLRVSVKQRYSDDIDYKQYEAQIQKLIDTHITTDEVIQITEQVNIFDKDKFQQEVEGIEGTAAQADTMASRLKKTLTEKMNEDPTYYKKFSDLLEETIKEYRDKRITDAEYLQRMKEMVGNVLERKGDDTPSILEGNDNAKAFYGVAGAVINRKAVENTDNKQLSAEIGVAIDEIIKKYKIVDFQSNVDVQNKMRTAIDEYLYELNKSLNLRISFDEMDEIIDTSIEVAKNRYK